MKLSIAVVPAWLFLLHPFSFAADIEIALEGGSLLVIEPQFIHNVYGADSPRLTFTLVNRTPDFWRTLILQFDMEGTCRDERRQWSRQVTTSLGYMQDQEVRKSISEMVTPLIGKVDGCVTTTVTARLIVAENMKFRINGLTGQRTDLVAERKAQEAADAERRRIEEAEAAKAEAAEEAAARKRESEEKRLLAIEEARAAKERVRIRLVCATAYRNTSNKKVSDLTVKEEQQVRTCQVLGLYPPQ